MKALLLSCALALAGMPLVQAQSSTADNPAPAGPAGTGITHGTTTGTMSSGPGDTASTRGSGDSLLPWTRRGWAGLSIGKPEFQGGCGSGFGCDDADARMHLFTGGFVNDWLGAEIGYRHEGETERAGGRTRAQGLDLSLVLQAPLGAFRLHGKLGALYGRTQVSADPLAGVATGKESGWGAAYGVGVGVDVTPNSGLVLEWARSRYRFPGDGREDIDATSLGWLHRF
jgi:hypothetical protein